MERRHQKHNQELETESARMHHVTPPAIYFGVFAALMALTAVTVAVAYADLGWLSTPIALVIASIKAALVILYFMHVRWSTHLIWVVVIGSFVWLGVLFVLTFSDYLSRGITLA
ncbi:MAG TPA: cytochrome C oxidase subunit IV family protein [Thermoanaerobaculia bacterium]|nr:cytochrome C oxidase subunit IV family protein [Thermoanaerobaculia bacterium]